MNPSTPCPSALGAADRSYLKNLLAVFRSSWTETALAERVAQRPSSGLLRHTAMRELVKVDLEFWYSRGCRPHVEAYLIRYPELGTPDNVDVDLLHAEFCAGKAHGL